MELIKKNKKKGFTVSVCEIWRAYTVTAVWKWTLFIEVGPTCGDKD